MTLAAFDSFVCDQADATRELRGTSTSEAVQRQSTNVGVNIVDGKVVSQGNSINQLLAVVTDPKTGKLAVASVSQFQEVLATANKALARYTIDASTVTPDGKLISSKLILGSDGSQSEIVLDARNILIGSKDTSSVYPFEIHGGESYLNHANIRILEIDKLVDSDGNVVYQNGKLQSKYIAADQLVIGYGQVQNAPPSDSDNTGKNTAKNISGQGAFATQNQITKNNVAALIESAAIGRAYIANAAIGNAQIDTAAITDAKIKDGSITNAKIDTAAITDAKIKNGAITNAKIGAAAVDTLQIANQAVTFPDLITQLNHVDVGNDWTDLCVLKTHTTGARCSVTWYANYYSYAKNFTPDVTFRLTYGYGSSNDSYTLFNQKVATSYGDNSDTASFALNLKHGSEDDINFKLSMKSESDNSGSDFQAIAFQELKDNK